MNWERWMLERLPYKVRTVIMFTLCMIYVSFIRRLYDEYVEWKKKMRGRLSASPQVCVLRKVVHDELGITIEIDEGDGKPFDFIVKASTLEWDKERQMHALIDRYKLAGRSYLYINKEVSYEAEWSDSVCEQCEFLSGWDGYICEQKAKEEIILTTKVQAWSDGTLTVEVTPSKAPPRDITFMFDSYDGIAPFYGVVPAWNSSKQTFRSPGYFDLRRLSMQPGEDYDYKYILKLI